MEPKDKWNLRTILYTIVVLPFLVLGTIWGWSVIKQVWPVLVVMGILMFIWEYPLKKNRTKSK
jgi:hypothetical protein